MEVTAGWDRTGREGCITTVSCQEHLSVAAACPPWSPRPATQSPRSVSLPKGHQAFYLWGVKGDRVIHNNVYRVHLQVNRSTTRPNSPEVTCEMIWMRFLTPVELCYVIMLGSLRLEWPLCCNHSPSKNMALLFRMMRQNLGPETPVTSKRNTGSLLGNKKTWLSKPKWYPYAWASGVFKSAFHSHIYFSIDKLGAAVESASGFLAHPIQKMSRESEEDVPRKASTSWDLNDGFCTLQDQDLWLMGKPIAFPLRSHLSWNWSESLPWEWKERSSSWQTLSEPCFS